MKKNNIYMRTGRAFLFFVVFAVLYPSNLFAANTIEKEDKDKNGKADTWIERDSTGRIVSVARDKHVDGKPDAWVYYSPDGIAERREWDRNFDGKSDFKTFEIKGRFIEKQYDDNFDGKFEKTEKAPPKGFSGRTKTTATP